MKKNRKPIEEMEDLTDYHLSLLIEAIQGHIRLLEQELAKHPSYRKPPQNNANIEQEIASKRLELKVFHMAMRVAPLHFPIKAQERAKNDIIFASNIVGKIEHCKATITKIHEDLGIAPENWIKNKQLNTKAESAAWLQTTVTELRILQLALRGLEVESHGQHIDTYI